MNKEELWYKWLEFRKRLEQVDATLSFSSEQSELDEFQNALGELLDKEEQAQ